MSEPKYKISGQGNLKEHNSSLEEAIKKSSEFAGFHKKKKKSFHNSSELYSLFIQMLWIRLITECIKTKGLSDSPWQTTQVNYSALHVQVWWFWVRLSDSYIFILMCTSKAKHFKQACVWLGRERTEMYLANKIYIWWYFVLSLAMSSVALLRDSG